MTWFDRRGVRAAARPAKRTSPGGRAETCTNRYKSVNGQTVSTADLGWPIDVLRWDRFWINKRTSEESRVRLARPCHPHLQCCGARAASRALRKCAFIYPPRSALNGATLATLNAGGKGDGVQLEVADVHLFIQNRSRRRTSMGQPKVMVETLRLSNC